MSETKSEFEFILEKPFLYMKDGVEVEAKTLILKSPCRNNGRIISKLRQGFSRGMKSLQQGNTNNDSSQNQNSNSDFIRSPSEKSSISATEIVIFMDMSDTSMPDYEDSFEKLLLNDICYLDEKEKLTKPLAVKIDCEDFLRLLGEYLENFTMSSWRKMMTAKK